jgi:hypothetical protein
MVAIEGSMVYPFLLSATICASGSNDWNSRMLIYETADEEEENKIDLKFSF